MPLSSCFSSLINLVCVLCLCLSFLFLQFFPYLFGFLLSPPPTPKFGSFLIYFMRTLKVFRQYSFYLNLLRWNFLISLFEFCYGYFWCLFNFVHGGFCWMEVSNFYVAQCISLLLCGFAFEVMIWEVRPLLQGYINIQRDFHPVLLAVRSKIINL